MRPTPELTKRPDEMYPVGIKLVSPDLEQGETIQSCTVTITPDEAGGLKTSGSVVIDQDTVEQVIYGGIAGSEYRVYFETITSGGHVYEDMIFVKVRNLE